MARNGMRPVHPGEILKEEFLVPLGLSANGLAQALEVPANRITAILNETRGVTGDTAMRLSAYFGTSPEFWMNLQSLYDLRRAESEVPKPLLASIRKAAQARSGSATV